MHKLNQKAFTLIEILVVLSIIALISTVALFRLQGIRQNAKDAIIKDLFHNLTLRTEINFSNDGNYEKVCMETVDVSLDSSLSAGYADFEEEIKKNNGSINPVCNESSDKKSYAVWTKFPTRNGWWCVSSATTPREWGSQPSLNSVNCQ
ncbi:MAG: type II secretion system protein [Candidatus Parcubacteria bacterium]|nr:type II secretion system protein [Candidatus Parcubacteria bacterium]